MIEDKCLFYLNGSWMYNIWEGKDAEKVMNCVPNEFPVFRECDAYPGGYMVMWGVLKNSPNRDEAVKFLLELNIPDIAEMWVQYTKCPTGIKGKLTDVNLVPTPLNNLLTHSN
jgi:ABC-type glycerol-3-phosphate transport system substrate-binding protein